MNSCIIVDARLDNCEFVDTDLRNLKYGKYLVSGSTDKTVKLWRVESQKEVTTLQGHSKSVVSIAFSPDGKYLASGSVDNTIKLWSV